MITDLIPAKYRKLVYGLAALGSLAFSVYQASEGDWGEFTEGLIAGLVNVLAHQNVNTSEDDDA